MFNKTQVINQQDTCRHTYKVFSTPVHATTILISSTWRLPRLQRIWTSVAVASPRPFTSITTFDENFPEWCGTPSSMEREITCEVTGRSRVAGKGPRVYTSVE